MTVIDVTAATLDILTYAIFVFAFGFILISVLIGMLQTMFSIQDQGAPIVGKLIVLLFLLTYIGGDIYERLSYLFLSF